MVVATGVTEDATASNNQVKLVRDSAGRLIVAYAQIIGGLAGTRQVVLSVSADGGSRWMPLAQASSGPDPSRLPAIALDSSGRLHVVWTRYLDGVGKIYYRVWAGRWTAPQALVSPLPGYAGYPALALDGSGQPQVLWYGIREGNTVATTRHAAIYEIYYIGYDGKTWSRPLLISTGLPDAINPAVAADRAGRLHAVWYQFDHHAYQVRYAERGGAVWSQPETVFHTSLDEFNPDLAVDPQGRVSLAWEHHAGQGSTIYYARRSGERWDGPVALSAGASPARHPAVAAGPGGDVYVAWDQDDGQIYLRHYTGRWDPVLRLTAEGGNTFPSLLADDARADVVWTHTSGPPAAARSAVFFIRVPRR